jgi:hypothetical protein
VHCTARFFLIGAWRRRDPGSVPAIFAGRPELRRPGMTPIEIFVAVLAIAFLVWMVFDQFRLSRHDQDRD